MEMVNKAIAPAVVWEFQGQEAAIYQTLQSSKLEETVYLSQPVVPSSPHKPQNPW